MGGSAESLGSRVLPLLLQHPGFIPESEQRSTELDSQRVGRVLSINCHGGCKADVRRLKDLGLSRPKKEDKLFSGGSTDLYPAVAMFNHSSQPSCTHFPVAREGGQVMLAVVACRSICKGEELTVQYIADAGALARKWGIKE
eukprot:4791011-Amphidinium_carterae.2